MSNTDSHPGQCQKCGAPLSSDAVGGLCPRCLMALNLATQTDVPDDAGPPGTKVVSPPPAPAEIAALFPQLQILECLGRGGMGVVYKARQPRLNRLVALKLLAPEKGADARFAERFAREAQALARLSHPNIVTVYDFGEAGGRCYLLMEFVDGLSLRQMLQSRKLAPEEALAIVPRICEALQYAHEQDIVHRDIKPENILLDKQGRVKIADFGIAKIVGPSSKEVSLTGAKDVVGTPHYMAPEQIEHPLQVDHRADIYSLGVVFYEMLTGELPLGKFAAPSKKVQVDVRLDEVVLHTLEKEPERRYQQAGQVRTDVETIAATPSGSSRESTPVRDRGERAAAAAQSNAKEAFIVFAGMIVFALLLSVAVEVSRTSVVPLKGFLIGITIVGLLISGLSLAGIWPFPSPWFPEPNFSSRNLRRRKRSSPSVGEPGRHFSRAAIAGGAWVGVAYLAVCVAIGAQIVTLNLGDSLLWRCVLALSLAAPLGATILGWIAVAQIRRSAGRLYGLGLALFDGLLFPFLTLLAALWFLWVSLGDWIHPVLGISTPSLAFNLLVGVPWVASSALLCTWVVHHVRGLFGRLDVAPGNEPSYRSERLLRRFTATVALLLLCGLAFVCWAQRPRLLGDTYASDSPDGRFQATGQTLWAMRVFGSDELFYRFSVCGLGGAVFEHWRIPVPLAKLATNYVAVPLDELEFKGDIHWSADSKRVSFLVRDVEVFSFNVTALDTPSQDREPATRPAAANNLLLVIHDDMGLDLDTGALRGVSRQTDTNVLAALDIGWDNDGGGALMRNPAGAARILALPDARDFEDAVAKATSRASLVRNSEARGSLASQCRFFAILTDRDSLVAVEVTDPSETQATLRWRILRAD